MKKADTSVILLASTISTIQLPLQLTTILPAALDAFVEGALGAVLGDHPEFELASLGPVG